MLRGVSCAMFTVVVQTLCLVSEIHSKIKICQQNAKSSLCN